MYSYHAIVVLNRTTIDAFECLAQLSRRCIFHIVLKLQVSHSLMLSLICLGRPTGRTKAERWLQICFDPCLDISDPSRHALPDNIVLISIDHVSYQHRTGSMPLESVIHHTPSNWRIKTAATNAKTTTLERMPGYSASPAGMCGTFSAVVVSNAHRVHVEGSSVPSRLGHVKLLAPWPESNPLSFIIITSKRFTIDFRLGSIRS